MDEAQPVNRVLLTAYGASDIGRKRSNNEDAFFVSPLRKSAIAPQVWPLDVSTCSALLAVADGVGGENAGEIASKLTLDTLVSSLLTQSERHHQEDALKLSVERAHQAVRRAATDHHKGMGSTLVAALVTDDAAYVCGVGDSRMYLYRDGALEQVTKDHTLYQHAIDRGATLMDGANAHHVLLQVIGQPRDLELEVRRIPIRAGDVLLLCSDGLSGMVPDAELALELANPSPVDAVVGELITLANANGGHDNVTVVVARVSPTS
jgi:protein phosphatase